MHSAIRPASLVVSTAILMLIAALVVWSMGESGDGGGEPRPRPGADAARPPDATAVLREHTGREPASRLAVPIEPEPVALDPLAKSGAFTWDRVWRVRERRGRDRRSGTWSFDAEAETLELTGSRDGKQPWVVWAGFEDGVLVVRPRDPIPAGEIAEIRRLARQMLFLLRAWPGPEARSRFGFGGRSFTPLRTDRGGLLLVADECISDEPTYPREAGVLSEIAIDDGPDGGWVTRTVADRDREHATLAIETLGLGAGPPPRDRSHR